MTTAQQLLDKKKSKTVWSIAPDATVLDAIAKMAEGNVGALVVLDGEKLVGIFSERDYARKGILMGRKSQKTAVIELMTPNVITVTPNTPLADMMRLTTEHKIRHLPVLDEHQKVVGVLSITDIIYGSIEEQRAEIQMLEDYAFRR